MKKETNKSSIENSFNPAELDPIGVNEPNMRYETLEKEIKKYLETKQRKLEKEGKHYMVRKNRTSKYVNKTFSGWTVKAIGIARIQPKNAKYAYHQSYYYLLERTTSDGKCIKQIRLNANYMCNFAKGLFDIESYADKHAHSKVATRKTNYSFN